MGSNTLLRVARESRHPDARLIESVAVYDSSISVGSSPLDRVPSDSGLKEVALCDNDFPEPEATAGRTALRDYPSAARPAVEPYQDADLSAPNGGAQRAFELRGQAALLLMADE